MPLDILPNAITTPTRDAVEADYVRDYALRNPNVQVVPGSLPAIDAKVFADNAMPLYAIAIKVSNSVRRSKATGDDLTQWSVDLGGGGRLPAAGATGYVTAGPGTASGGATIFQHDQGKIGTAIYECTITGNYKPGDPVPLQGLTVGAQSDQPAGALLSWTSPRPGQDPTAKVLAQADGSGLSGGRVEETDDELQLRLDFIEANPPASGNESEYVEAILQTPGLAVGAAFAYPDLSGPGSICVVFLLRASRQGANRIPSAAAIAQVDAWLTGKFPASDARTVGMVVASPVDVTLNVSWLPGGPGWTDLVTYPLLSISGNNVIVKAAPTPTATVFALDISGTSSSGPQAAPAVGATIGFFDAANQVFRRKRVLSVVVVGTTATVTCDTTNGVSDTSYAPFVGQMACPWSDSLNDLVPAVQGYFDKLGPGEQIAPASQFDPGLRQKRSPPSPQTWPNVLNNRLITPVEAVPSVGDAVLLSPAPPYATPVGTPGVSSFLLTLRGLAAFPE